MTFSKDVNDQEPKFSENYYFTQVVETATSGDIFQVNAIDLDAPHTVNSKVSYKIEHGAKDTFAIDPHSGVIRLADLARLDRDQNPFYVLKIVAADMGPPYSKEIKTNASSCYLRIDVLDVNNKKPKFRSNLDLTPKLFENVPVGTFVTQIKAKDLDLNSKLNYFFVKNSNSDNINISLTSDKFEAFDDKRRPIDVDLIKVILNKLVSIIVQMQIP